MGYFVYNRAVIMKDGCVEGYLVSEGATKTAARMSQRAFVVPTDYFMALAKAGLVVKYGVYLNGRLFYKPTPLERKIFCRILNLPSKQVLHLLEYEPHRLNRQMDVPPLLDPAFTNGELLMGCVDNITQSHYFLSFFGYPEAIENIHEIFLSIAEDKNSKITKHLYTPGDTIISVQLSSRELERLFEADTPKLQISTDGFSERIPLMASSADRKQKQRAKLDWITRRYLKREADLDNNNDMDMTCEL